MHFRSCFEPIEGTESGKCYDKDSAIGKSLFEKEEVVPLPDGCVSQVHSLSPPKEKLLFFRERDVWFGVGWAFYELNGAFLC